MRQESLRILKFCILTILYYFFWVVKIFIVHIGPSQTPDHTADSETFSIRHNFFGNCSLTTWSKRFHYRQNDEEKEVGQKDKMRKTADNRRYFALYNASKNKDLLYSKKHKDE